MKIKLFKKKSNPDEIKVGGDLTPKGVKQVGQKLPFNEMAEKQLPLTNINYFK